MPPKVGSTLAASLCEDDEDDDEEQEIDNDDAGFSGGPSNISLLTQYQDHVAWIIWDGQDRVVKVVSHIKKVKKLGPPHPSVLPFVVASGLSPLCDILYEGCTIFANKSATYVRTHYLELFRDLPTCRTYAWGVVALVYLYEQLGDANFANTKQVAGYLPLLQLNEMLFDTGLDIRALPTLRRKQLRDTYVETEPRVRHYIIGRATSVIADVRVQLDALTYDGVIWNPYGAHWASRPLVVSAMFYGYLRLGILVHRHLPERVLRQFGFMQPIP
ncbi:protein MAIN-LIKE 2-like [Vigna unguiculata]|uniref:protein MAIN-LIKE 2-like n=1 Tax=Vigna unguiculata TaxID=3917 RepID=UPI0010167757|nr:protein MAIN-LIKE 2-like [Vigna unguiculata]